MKQRNLMLLLLVTITISMLLFFGCSKNEQQTKKSPQETKKVQKPEAEAVNYNDMVFVPAGDCIIGGPANNVITKTSSPPHKVFVKSFWIDKYEVTFEQYFTFVADTGYLTEGNWRNYYAEGKELTPVVNVTYKDALAYAKWAKKRLPTQEEWEKAASWDPVKKEQRRWPWGNEWKEGMSNTGESGYRQPVDIGKFKGDVSFYGAHDMLGNVFEWTSSYYNPYKGCKARDKNFHRKLKVVKGASCYIKGAEWYLSARSALPKNAILGQGFRCVRDATPQEEAKYKDMYKNKE